MAYKTNQFCWHGIISTDVAKATDFYSKALPFGIMKTDMGGDEIAMVTAADIPRAHLSAPQMEDVASHWESYLRVDDVDASTKKAVANGGSLIVPGMDIPVGRFSVIASPSGAAFCLFHEADEATATNPPTDGPGAVHWNELWSKDLEADLAWLTSTFGFTTETMEMPDGPYTVLLANGEYAGGVFASQMEEAPSMWLNWVEVVDVDATLSDIEAAGGGAVSPAMDVPMVGRMAVVKDPTGGVFGVIKPTNRG